jgi:hypothetical protein
VVFTAQETGENNLINKKNLDADAWKLLGAD